MAEKITLPTDIQLYRPEAADYKIKMLVYGPPGVGKTTLAASAEAVPSMAPVLFINIEGGVLAITDPSVYGAKEVPQTFDFTDFGSMSKLYSWLAKGDHPFKTIVVDSLSELQRYNLDHVIAEKIARGASDRSGKLNRDEDDVFLEDYGSSAKQMRRLMRRLRNLPMHVIFTAHDQPHSDEADSPVGPALTKGFRRSAEGYVDILAYMYIGTRKVAVNGDDKEQESEPVRRLITRPRGRWTAKDRSPGQRLDPVIDEPNMGVIMKQIATKRNG